MGSDKQRRPWTYLHRASLNHLPDPHICSVSGQGGGWQLQGALTKESHRVWMSCLRPQGKPVASLRRSPSFWLGWILLSARTRAEKLDRSGVLVTQIPPPSLHGKAFCISQGAKTPFHCALLTRGLGVSSTNGRCWWEILGWTKGRSPALLPLRFWLWLWQWLYFLCGSSSRRWLPSLCLSKVTPPQPQPPSSGPISLAWSRHLLLLLL